jgi:hypothetical protein
MPKLSIVKSEPLPASTGKLSIVKSEPVPRRDSAGDAVEGVMDGLGEAIKAIPDALRHPLDSAYQMFEASKDQYQKAVKAAGPGRDNKGDVAGFIQHAAGMFPVLGPMASNLLDAVDSGADSYEVGKRMGNLLSLEAPGLATKAVKGAAAAAPVTGAVIKGAAGGVRDAVKSVPVELSKYGVDVAFNMPAVKVLAGAGIGGTTAAAMGLPHGLGAAIGGAAPIVAGVIKGARAGLEAFRGGGRSLVTSLDKMAQRAGFEDFASVPADVKPLIQNAFEAEVDRLAQTPPKVTPVPAGVTPSGPVRPPVATAAQMMREAGTFRPKETFVPGGPLRPPVRTLPAKVPAATVPEIVPPAAVETPQPVTPAPSAAGKPVTAATLMEEAARPDLFQDLRDMREERQRAVRRLVEGMDEAQLQEYREALANDSNIHHYNQQTMADRVTRFMKKNGIEPTDSGIVRALHESAEDMVISPTTGRPLPSFKAADHEVLFDMIKDRMETPPAGAKPVASPPPTPAKAPVKPRSKPVASPPPTPAKPAAKPRSKQTTVGELMGKVKSAKVKK